MITSVTIPTIAPKDKPATGRGTSLPVSVASVAGEVAGSFIDDSSLVVTVDVPANAIPNR